jgi:hypothetical protein
VSIKEMNANKPLMRCRKAFRCCQNLSSLVIQGIVWKLPLPGYRKCCQPMSHISFYMKSLGQRSAGKPHAALDVAGAGNVLLCSGAPVLDPTCERLEGWFLLPTRLRCSSGFDSDFDVKSLILQL